MPGGVMARFYRWIFDLAGRERAPWALAFVSFIESTIFPIPPDTLLAPMVIASPHRAYRLAAICAVASVLGGVVGYFIGVLAFEQIGTRLIDHFALGDSFAALTERYERLGGVAVLIAAVTPIPYKAVTIFSGAAGFPLAAFIVFSAVGRTARFMLVAWIMKRFGEPMRQLIERRAMEVTLVGALIVVAFFVWTRLH